jgi:hypothetical protein
LCLRFGLDLDYNKYICTVRRNIMKVKRELDSRKVKRGMQKYRRDKEERREVTVNDWEIKDLLSPQHGHQFIKWVHQSLPSQFPLP